MTLADKKLAFTTARLAVIEIDEMLASSERTTLLARIPHILTAPVVEHLPPYFHGIDSVELADTWLTRMLAESRFFQVKFTTDETIGFLFAYVEDETQAHIGYLLAKEAWGKGLASELLQGFIHEASRSTPWVKLIGGVDHANLASAHLLKKLGFVDQGGSESPVIFFEYKIR
ncbi:GNAT family N-acetyltransferase [Shewanella insulae]|uniref:GNAT family N-acetyltransferase n=2 Tax=Shewanella insulae TaxID=2681496 RepID=UPI001EFCC005|nr:GNAT family N-acetyltransferase [Shewanella insulae]MCG9755460.1 GNAT family N-acetyltransferase [Shewanella insulae]